MDETTKTKKWINILLIVILLLIPLTLSVYFRIQPYNMLPIDKYASSSVMNYYRNQVAAEVENKYAYKPPEAKQKMVNEQMAILLKEKKDIIAEQTQYVSEQLKSQLRADNGDPYLGDIDTWMQYYYARNYVEYGMAGDKIVDGVMYNSFRDGRNGQIEIGRFHPWLMAQFHHLMTIFNPGISVMASVFLFPVFWITLSIIPAFFIGRRLSNNFGGFIAAILIAIHPVIMSRTTGGVADTDLHNVFFPLFIMWFMVEAYAAKHDWSRIVWTTLAGIFTGFYAAAWNSGWWYTFDFILAAVVGFIVYKIIKDRRIFKSKIKDIFLHFKELITILVVYFASSFAAVVFMWSAFVGNSIMASIHQFSYAFTSIFGFLKIYEVGTASIWPNVLTTVAELNNTSTQSVIGSIGSPILFILGLLGLVFVMLRTDTDDTITKTDYILVGTAAMWYLLLFFMSSKITSPVLYVMMILLPVASIGIYNLFHETGLKMKYAIMLSLFFAGTFFSGTRGVRFIALLAPIIGITIGVAAGKIYDVMGKLLAEGLNINKILVKVTIAVLLLVMILPNPINKGWAQTTNEMTMYNDGWDKTLKKINQTSEDGIITSWWDYGHWFVANAERKVTFDGGAQGDRIHWVGKILLTDNETEALSVLQMLNCGLTNARYRIEKVYPDNYKAINILYEVIHTKDKVEATSLLQGYSFSTEDINFIIKNTKCEDLIPQYFIASEDMVAKSGVWAHFGIWDFNRANMYNKVSNSDYASGIKILTEEYGYSSTDSSNIYNEIKTNGGDTWISPWPNYDSKNGIATCQAVKDIIQCKNGLIYNTTSEEGFIMTNQGLVHPIKFSYIDKNGTFQLKTYTDSKLNYGVALFPNTNSKINTKYGSIGMSPELTGSMFTRMFFFDGAGLEKFRLLSHEVGIDGTNIYSYKIQW
jgi:asparagine N-glycosylation enzyme membrane subunit Stt3